MNKLSQEMVDLIVWHLILEDDHPWANRSLHKYVTISRKFQRAIECHTFETLPITEKTDFEWLQKVMEAHGGRWKFVRDFDCRYSAPVPEEEDSEDAEPQNNFIEGLQHNEIDAIHDEEVRLFMSIFGLPTRKRDGLPVFVNALRFLFSMRKLLAFINRNWVSSKSPDIAGLSSSS